jgi:hypothetical protein
MKKLAVANGSYQKDGQEKTRWVNVGVIGVSQNGKEYMLIDPTINFAAFPREEGKDMVMVGIFEEQNNQSGGNNQKSYQAPQQQQAPTQYVNAQNQIIDAQGKLILFNGQAQYAQQ